MVQDLRVKVEDEVHAWLKAMSVEQKMTLSQVINALVRQSHAAHDEAETKLDVMLLQLQRLQAMIEALVAAKQEMPEPEALPVATYEDLYRPMGEQIPTKGEEQISAYFRPPPKRGLLNRLLYKEEG